MNTITIQLGKDEALRLEQYLIELLSIHDAIHPIEGKLNGFSRSRLISMIRHIARCRGINAPDEEPDYSKTH